MTSQPNPTQPNPSQPTPRAPGRRYAQANLVLYPGVVDVEVERVVDEEQRREGEGAVHVRHQVLDRVLAQAATRLVASRDQNVVQRLAAEVNTKSRALSETGLAS